jgi:hypothetical protein
VVRAIFGTKLRAVGVYLLIVILYGVSTLILTYPMVGKVCDHLFGGGDSFFLPWVLSWVFHNVSLSPSTLFNANIFYPAPNSLAFSEHHLSAQVLYAPLYLLSGNPVLSYNLVLLLSYVCLGLAMFALVRYLTGDALAAVIGGFIFAFSPVRFFPYPHLQLMLIWWSPLALLFLERHLRRPTWRDFILFCVMFWLQFLSSTYLGLYLGTMALLRLAWAALVDGDAVWNRQMLAKFACFGVASLVVLTPFLLPYLHVSRQWRYTRSLGENIASSAELTSYLSAGPGNYLYGHLLSHFSYHSWPKFLFPGFVPVILALVGAWAVLGGRVPAFGLLTRAGRAYVALGTVSLVLSLGPFLIWRGHVTHIPLPYFVLYHFLPGYQAMRIPARFGLWVGLAMAVLAGVGCHAIREEITRRSARWNPRPVIMALAVTLLVVVIGLEAYTPVHPLPVPVNEQVPAVYQYLATEDRSPVIELPMPKTVGPDAVHWAEMERTYFSIYHRRPMANGYSGFTPPSFDEIATLVNRGPRPQMVRALAALGLSTIVLHLNEMSGEERKAWLTHDLDALGMREVARFGADRVLKLMSAASPANGLTVELDLLRILPLGESVRVSLELRSASEEPWVDRLLQRWLDLELRWNDARGCEVMASHQTVGIPLVLLHEDPARLSIVAPTPTRAGAYEVTVSSRLFSASKRVSVREVFPARSGGTAGAVLRNRSAVGRSACDRTKNGDSGV